MWLFQALVFCCDVKHRDEEAFQERRDVDEGI
jgi:hypothetical protein